jgi:hypothetical protein
VSAGSSWRTSCWMWRGDHPDGPGAAAASALVRESTRRSLEMGKGAEGGQRRDGERGEAGDGCRARRASKVSSVGGAKGSAVRLARALLRLPWRALKHTRALARRACKASRAAGSNVSLGGRRLRAGGLARPSRSRDSQSPSRKRPQRALMLLESPGVPVEKIMRGIRTRRATPEQSVGLDLILARANKAALRKAGSAVWWREWTKSVREARASSTSRAAK